MKNITPIQIWKDGQLKTASILNARIINDDLSSSCCFYWWLTEESATIAMTNGITLAEGNSYMSNEDYQDWDGTNHTAYAFIATQINVVIVTV